MTAQTAVLRGRAAAEALMVDACTVTTDGAVTTDDLTGATSTALTTVYSGKCKIQQSTALGRRVDAGETDTMLLRLEVHLPVVGSEQVVRGALVTITAATLDAALVGRRFRIRDDFHKTRPPPAGSASRK
jgi:hypothetical protein